MASDQILFDSEELHSQNKENITLNDTNTQMSQSKQTDTPLLELMEENSGADKIEKSPNSKMSEAKIKEIETIISNPESQSSQEILDTIGKDLQISHEILGNSNIDTESQNSQEILDSIGKIQKPVTSIEKPIPKVLSTHSSDLVDTSTSEIPESMEISHEVDEDLPGQDGIDVDDTPVEKDAKTIPSKESAAKNCMFPLSRVKLIMKTDPNVKVVSSEATILAALAAEKFLKFIIEETVRVTQAHKKKTLLKQHFDEAIQGLEVTEFLEGMMEDEE